jgi:hypothetical protein
MSTIFHARFAARHPANNLWQIDLGRNVLFRSYFICCNKFKQIISTANGLFDIGSVWWYLSIHRQGNLTTGCRIKPVGDVFFRPYLPIISSPLAECHRSLLRVRFQEQRYFRVLHAAARSSPPGLRINLPLSLRASVFSASLSTKPCFG